MSAKPLLISYLRFSTAQQLKGDSQRRQVEQSETWAKEHKLTIDQDLQDRGLSGYTGENAKYGAFATFLELAKSGRIPTGSILLVEDLDRLSRLPVEESVQIFLQIINAGIKIVTLKDGGEYEKGKLDIGKLMMSVMRFYLAHEESQKKAHRLAACWDNKRKTARDDGEIYTTILPHWLKCVGGMKNGHIVVDEAKANVVRSAFKLALTGYGLDAIVKKFNAEATPAIGKRKEWQRSYISKLLHNRAVIGEFQAYKGSTKRGGMRVPMGDPVPGYFPPILSEDHFYAAQQAIASRKTIRGKGGKGGRNSQFVNLFAGLVCDLQGRSVQINSKGYGRRYVSSGALKGIPGTKFCGFPVSAFEKAFMIRLADSSLFAGERDDSSVEIAAMEGKVVDVDAKIETIHAQVLDGRAGPSVVDLLDKLDAQRAQFLEALERLKAKAASNGGANTAMAHLMEFLTTPPTDYDGRLRLRNAIGQVVKKINCHFERDGQRDYICSTMVELANGREFDFAFRANHTDTMLRDGLGHPIKGGTKGEPRYTIDMVIEQPG